MLVSLCSGYLYAYDYDDDKQRHKHLNHDQKLRSLAEIEPTFAGLYADKNGNTVVSFARPIPLQHKAFTSQYALNSVVGVSLANHLSIIYGAQHFLDIEAQAELVRMAGLQHLPQTEQKVYLKQVKYPFYQLYDWYHGVRNEVFNVKGVITGEIDEVQNKVRIHATDLASIAKVKKILLAAGLPKDAFIVQISSPISPKANLLDRFIPIKYGSQIFRFDYPGEDPEDISECTAGLEIEINGQRGMLTNAHCTIDFGVANDGTQIYQGTLVNKTLLGDSTLESSATQVDCLLGYICYNSDAAFIPIPGNVSSEATILKSRYLNSSPTNRELKTGRNSAWSRLFIFDNVQTRVGDTVFKTGITTGTTSGTVTNGCIDVDMNVRGVSILVKCAMRADRHGDRFAGGGDSGSVILGTLIGSVEGSDSDGGLDGVEHWPFMFEHSNAARVVGLLFAGDRIYGEFAYFTPINVVLADLTPANEPPCSSCHY